MKTTYTGVVVAPLSAEIWLYCERDYSAPHSLMVTVATDEAPGIDAAHNLAGITAVCDYCGSVNGSFGVQRTTVDDDE